MRFESWRVKNLTSGSFERLHRSQVENLACSRRLSTLPWFVIMAAAIAAYAALLVLGALLIMLVWMSSEEQVLVTSTSISTATAAANRTAGIGTAFDQLFFTTAFVVSLQGAGFVDVGAVPSSDSGAILAVLSIERFLSVALVIYFVHILVVLAPKAVTAAVYSPQLVLNRGQGDHMVLQFRVAHPRGRFLLDPHVQFSAYFRELEGHSVITGTDVHEANLPVRMHSVLAPEQIITHFVTEDSPLHPIVSEVGSAGMGADEVGGTPVRRHIMDLVSHFGVFITGLDSVTMERVVSYKLWESGELQMHRSFVASTVTSDGIVQSHPFQGKSFVDMRTFAETQHIKSTLRINTSTDVATLVQDGVVQTPTRVRRERRGSRAELAPGPEEVPGNEEA